jgi:hypothetical protein
MGSPTAALTISPRASCERPLRKLTDPFSSVNLLMRIPLVGLSRKGLLRVRRIGVLMNLAADDPESVDRVTALAQGLAELGCN